MTDRNSVNPRLEAGLYLCELIRCAMDGRAPRDLPDGVTLGQVYSIAKHNSVESIAYFGAVKGDYQGDGELLGKWKSSVDSVIFRQACFDAEREAILAEMAKSGISYLPLKGIRLAALYPKPGMRSMGDNDILYGAVETDSDGNYRASADGAVLQKMTEIMESRGFEYKGRSGHHDTYHKAPFYNFEMHTGLTDEGDPSAEYYKNPWKRAVPMGGYEYTFSHEDDYIYNIAHMYTHYSDGGCGIRHIVDMHVIVGRFGDSMDHAYIEAELRKMGLWDFYKMIRIFTEDMFSENGEFRGDGEELLMFFLGCGTYGNAEQRIRNSLERIESDTGEKGAGVKLRYLRQRIFLTPEQCKKSYPKFYGKPYLAPVLIVYRLGKVIVRYPGRLSAELKRLWKYK